MNSDRRLRLIWLACLALVCIGFVCRIGFRIKLAFEADSNKGILWAGDWPILAFCQRFGAELVWATRISLSLACLISLWGTIREWRAGERLRCLFPVVFSVLSGLLCVGLFVGEFRFLRGGYVGLGLILGTWALSICSRPLGVLNREGTTASLAQPPHHWAPRILLGVILIAVIEVWALAFFGTSDFHTDEVSRAALFAVGLATVCGFLPSFGFMLACWLAKPVWRQWTAPWVIALTSVMCAVGWGGLVFGPAYQAFQGTLSSFGMLGIAKELVVWAMCLIGSLSVWGHLADVAESEDAVADGTWRFPALALSPLRGLIRTLTGCITLTSARWISVLSLTSFSALLVLSVYLTYWEFMDYSRGLHRSTSALMMASWLVVYLITLEWTARWLRPAQSSHRMAVSAAWLFGLGLIGLLPLVLLGSRFQGNVEFLMVDKTELNRTMITTLRHRLDHDRDGYSVWLGGDDPDDSNREVTNTTPLTTKGGLTPTAFPVSPETSPRKKPFLLVATIETYRSDCSAVYAPSRSSTTPRIDAFAQESTTFLNSYATANSTLPSQASLLTGSYPSRFLKKKRPMVLLDTLASAGYQTLLTEQVYDDVFLNNSGGAPKQFPEYKILGGWYANETLPALIAELDRRGGTPEGVCAVFHLNGAHFPYKPSKGIADPDDQNRYLQCLGEVDAAWGQFIQDLKTRGWYDDVCLVLTGDHGEEFWEHGHKYHGMYIYEESVRTPIIIKSPGSRPGKYQVAVSTIDILPTVADILSVPPARKVDGQSLAFALHGEPDLPATRPVFLVGAHSDTYGVIESGRWKLTFNRRMSYFEMYDLQTDPGELRNLIDQEPLKFQELRGLIADFIEAGQGLYTDPDPFEEEKPASK